MNSSRLKSIENYNDIKLRVVNIVSVYLNRTMPGLLGSINWYFQLKKHKSFLEFFLEKPILAINELIELYSGDKDYVKNILYLILKEIFANNRRFIEQAFKAIEDENDKAFKELIRKRFSILR
jgi:hypothetical protein